MIRRRFLGLATFAGVAGLATLEGMNTTEQKTVAFRIAGFTCITCAVGLETLLLKEKGVVRAKASYPANTVTITYHPGLTSEASLVKFIETTGFTATKES